MIMTMHIHELIHLRNLCIRCCAMHRKRQGDNTWFPAQEKVQSKWKSCKHTERYYNSQNAFGGQKEH